MHNTLQEFMKIILDQQQLPQASLFESQQTDIKIPDLNVLKQLYQTAWIDDWYPNEHTKEEYRKNGWKTLREYHETLLVSLPRVAFIEKGFTLKFRNTTVRGRIDRIDKIDGGYEIIDYKTGSPKEKLDWDSRRQLVLYQLAAEQCFDPPLTVKKLTYHYLENNSAVSFEATEKEKAKLENEILDAVEAMKKSDFSAKPGWQCKTCDFKDICEFSEA